jgi:hypothetical protein
MRPQFVAGVELNVRAGAAIGFMSEIRRTRAEIGLKRKKNADRLEGESIDFHNRFRQEYLQLASFDPER